MLGTAGIHSRPFISGEDLLGSIDELEPGCFLLDLRMPDLDGFQVMGALSERGIDWPVLVMTGHGEVPIAVRAMKMGAVDFLEKPFDESVLLAGLDRGFEMLSQRGEKRRAVLAAQQRIELLTAREREVLEGLMRGLSNKLIARDLDISLRTVEMHRANMMSRLQVRNLAEALTLAVQAGLTPPAG